jgi:membrane-associated protease RseP (regulator of RpoE activity)
MDRNGDPASRDLETLTMVARPARTVPPRWWLHLLLFVLTVVTTTIFGFALVQSFNSGQPLSETFIGEGYVRFMRGDPGIWVGWVYSVPLLLILLAHEFGHYIACQRWGVDATLPYFGPSPTLLGTIGAFIWIRSPIYSRKSLFDIGVAGPIAGFVMLLPILIAGVWMSRISSGVGTHGIFTFGTPLGLRMVEWLRFPGAAAGDIALHPVAMAAWAGLLATAINLLPIGQLDGGHILYAVLGERGHRIFSGILLGALVVFGFSYWPWWVWAVVMFFVRRHPLIYDREALGKPRVFVGASALILFLFSISVVPVQVH